MIPFKKYVSFFVKSPTVTVVIWLLLMLVAYLVGLKIVYILLLPLALCFSVRYPTIIKSLLSRYVTSLLLVFVFLQMSAIVQFQLWPQSNFTFIAVLSLVFTLLYVCIFKQVTLNSYKTFSSYVNRYDLYALLCVMVLVIPSLILILTSSATRLSHLGGIQGVDGVNHFIFITTMVTTQHFDYVVGGYYPKGFHLATAFMQTCFGISDIGSSWVSTAKLYFMQYVLLGGLMLYTIYYLFISIFNRIKENVAHHSTALYIGSSIAIGVTVSLFYLVDFMYNGFTSYYYICATIFMAAIYLFDYSKKSISSKYDLSLITYLILILGAGMSWPLLIPILLVIALLFYILNFKQRVKQFFSINTLAILFLVILNIVPLYYQLKYAGSSASDGVNLTGGLKTFHTAFVVLGTLLFCVFAYRKNISSEFRQVIQIIILPLLLFVAGLCFYQYFLVGEIRYYAIKTSFIVEIIYILILVALLADVMSERFNKISWYTIISIPLLTVAIVGYTISLSGLNPLDDLRNMFRSSSGVPAPAYFESDTKEIGILGASGKIIDSNTITMHVSDSGKLFTHMQAYYWSDVMSYKGTQTSLTKLICTDQVYKNLFTQNFGDEMQAQLINLINSCINIAGNTGRSFYIVTDDTSKVKLESIFTQKNVIFY